MSIPYVWGMPDLMVMLCWFQPTLLSCPPGWMKVTTRLNNWWDTKQVWIHYILWWLKMMGITQNKCIPVACFNPYSNSLMEALRSNGTYLAFDFFPLSFLLPPLCIWAWHPCSNQWVHQDSQLAASVLTIFNTHCYLHAFHHKVELSFIILSKGWLLHFV